jgi:hypothetical protein
MRDARIEELTPIPTGYSTHMVRLLNDGGELHFDGVPVLRNGLFIHAELLDFNPRQEARR